MLYIKDLTDNTCEIVLCIKDLTDEAYLRRHQRLEVDEKRRKRWDLQRQHELSVYEHLRRDHTGTQSTCHSSCSSVDISDGIEDALCAK